ncbi:hypothetical protein ACQB60_26330 [Actinomycetota bacterium Odt1-20B]
MKGWETFRSPRTFRLWRYGVGHSQLLFRAVPDAEHETCLDLHFEGVTAMQVGTRYVAPELRHGTARERAALLELAAGAQPDGGFRDVAFALQGGGGAEGEAGAPGLVLCRRARVLRGGADALGAPGGGEGAEVLWSGDFRRLATGADRPNPVNWHAAEELGIEEELGYDEELGHGEDEVLRS